jgi:hypothetical protein
MCQFENLLASCEMANITDDQKGQIGDWMERNRLTRCQICHYDRQVEPRFFAYPALSPGQTPGRRAVVLTYCPHCAMVVPLDVETMGIKR